MTEKQPQKLFFPLKVIVVNEPMRTQEILIVFFQSIFF